MKRFQFHFSVKRDAQSEIKMFVALARFEGTLHEKTNREIRCPRRKKGIVVRANKSRFRRTGDNRVTTFA